MYGWIRLDEMRFVILFWGYLEGVKGSGQENVMIAFIRAILCGGLISLRNIRTVVAAYLSFVVEFYCCLVVSVVILCQAGGASSVW